MWDGDDLGGGKRGHHSNDGTEGDDPGGHKVHKAGEEPLGSLEFPSTRRVIMRFSSLGVEVPGRIVYRENFGIMARAEEDKLSVQRGNRYWTKWCGDLAPMSLLPIVEVVHEVQR